MTAPSSVGGSVRAAITDAAGRLGHGDPVAAVDDLAAVDVGGLRRWGDLAAAIGRSLTDGTERLGRALPMLEGAWSSPAPRAAVRRHQEAGRTAHDLVDRQVRAALEAADTLESTRTAARAELARAEEGIRATGWPPGQDLLIWASGNGRLPAVAAAVGGLADGVRRLRARNDAVLHTLEAAMRIDPAGPVDELVVSMPAAFPGVTPEPPDSTVDQATLDRLAADLRSADPVVLAAAQGVQAALLRARAGGTGAQLLVYEPASPTGQGRAAISVGDLTRADNVVVMAPGVSSSLPELSDGIHDAQAMAGRAADLDPAKHTAVIAWYGYETPLAVDGGTPMTSAATAANVLAAGNDLFARVGGRQLVDDLDGFRSLAPADARFVGYGHSMGSTVVSAAAARGAGFDDVILVGSPGASVEVGSAADYPGMAPGHVWVNSFDRDPITTTVTDALAGGLFGGIVTNPLQPTPFGPDPADADFGARLLDVPSNAPDFRLHLGGPISGLTDKVATTITDLRLHHNGGNYLAGPSLDAMAAIVVGRYEQVPTRPGR